jgi:anthranilate synthase component 1
MTQETIQPDFKTFSRLARGGNLIPVYSTFTADLLTPVSAYLRLARQARYAFLLESVEGGEKIARYTFVGANPVEVFRYVRGACVLEGEGRVSWEQTNPLDFLRHRVERYRPVRVPGLPPLVAGAIGYFSYDMVRLFERIPDTGRDDVGADDAAMMFFLGMIVFDHVQHRIWIVRNVFTDGPGSLRSKYLAAVREIEATRRLLEQPVAAEQSARRPRRRSSARLAVTSNTTRARFEAAVRKAKSYIRAGDIFQVVVSRRTDVRIDADPFDLYRALRVVNPSPYMYFLKLDDTAVVGSSADCRFARARARRAGGSAPGSRNARRSQGARRAHHAGGFGAQRFGARLRIWVGASRAAGIRGALFARDALGLIAARKAAA